MICLFSFCNSVREREREREREMDVRFTLTVFYIRDSMQVALFICSTLIFLPLGGMGMSMICDCAIY